MGTRKHGIEQGKECLFVRGNFASEKEKESVLKMMYWNVWKRYY